MSYGVCRICGKPIREDKGFYCDKCNDDIVDHLIRTYNVFSPD